MRAGVRGTRGLSLAGAAMALLGLAASAGAAGNGPVKVFQKSNFAWTLPSDDWGFEEPTAGEVGLGYTARARRVVALNKEVVAWVRQEETKVTSLEVLTAQAKESEEKALAEVTKSETSTTTLAGVPAGLVTVSGSSKEGRATSARTYVALIGGRAYRLEVKGYGGAERKIPDEIETLVTGFKILKMPVATKAAADQSTRRFPNLHLTWSLPKPDGAKPSWSFVAGGNADLQPAESGWLAYLELAAPDGSQPISAELSARPYEPGQPMDKFVEKARHSHPLNDSLTVFPTATLTEPSGVGNFHGALLAASGVAAEGVAKSSAGKPLEVRVTLVLLHAVAYQLNVFLREGAGGRYGDAIKALTEGLRWDDVSQGFPGPYCWAFGAYTEPRGDALDKELDVKITKAHGFTIHKPAGWSLWKFDGSLPEFKYSNDHQLWWFVAEARKDAAYCMFAVETFLTSDLVLSTPPRDAAWFVDDIEKRWKAQFPDAVTRPKSKLSNRADGSFGEGKGITYEFRGSLGGVPYLERAWLVKTAQFLYWIRTQYGGKDAETTFAEPVKALSKGFVYEK